MIVEMRIYTLSVGRLEEYVQQYRETGFALQSRHLGEPLGWYVADGGPLSQVVSLWQYRDHDDRGSRRAHLQADEAWRDYLRQVTPLFDAMENRFLTPVLLAR
jgi:phytoene dehydrogenase-like protein